MQNFHKNKNFSLLKPRLKLDRVTFMYKICACVGVVVRQFSVAVRTASSLIASLLLNSLLAQQS